MGDEGVRVDSLYTKERGWGWNKSRGSGMEGKGVSVRVTER